MAVSLTVLGCSGSFADAGGACTGYLVDGGDTRVWLDAGPGTLGNLQTHGSLAELDAVVITHEHPDHWLELPVFANALRYYVRRSAYIPLYTTAPAADMIVAMSGSHDGSPPPFDFRIVSDGDEAIIGGQRWTFSRTDHYVETNATRVEVEGRSIAFSADTGPDWSFADFGDPVDIALSESTFLRRAGLEDVLHLSADEAGSLGAAAGVGSLVLTHIQPGDDHRAHAAAASATFGRPVELAELGATFRT